MFRTIRRAPWIALGAAGAYYLDGANGPARRREAGDRIRSLMDRAREQMRTGSGESAMNQMDQMDQMDQPGSGVRSPIGGSGGGAIIVEESEWRATVNSGPDVEHRRSEDTVAPTSKSASRAG